MEFAERSLVILIAKLAWAVHIRWPRDETMRNGAAEIRETIEYEAVPAPRPKRFGCDIQARAEGRVEVVRRRTAARFG